MITLIRALGTPRSAYLRADEAGGCLSVAELRQMLSPEFARRVRELIERLDPVGTHCEHASERALRLTRQKEGKDK